MRFERAPNSSQLDWETCLSQRLADDVNSESRRP